MNETERRLLERHPKEIYTLETTLLTKLILRNSVTAKKEPVESNDIFCQCNSAYSIK